MSDRPSVTTRQTFAHLLPRGGPREKYTKMRELGEESTAVNAHLQQQRQHLVSELHKAQAYLRECESASIAPPPLRLNLSYNAPPSGDRGIAHHVAPSDAKHVIADATARAEAAREQLARLDARLAALNANSIIRTISRLDEFLRNLPTGTHLEAARLPDPPKKPTTEAVKVLRAELDRHRTELQRVRSAPPPASAIKQRVAAEVAALAKPPTIHTAPGARNRLQPGMIMESLHGVGHLALPDGEVRQVDVVSTLRQADTLGLMLWLFKDSVVAALNAEVDRQLNGADTLDDATRTKREGELLAAVFDAELREERLVEQLGTFVARRDDADPCAILGLAPVTTTSSNRRAA